MAVTRIGKHYVVATHTVLFSTNQEVELSVPFDVVPLNVVLVIEPDSPEKNRVSWVWTQDATKVTIKFQGIDLSMGASVDHFSEIGEAAGGKKIGFTAVLVKRGNIIVTIIQFMIEV